MKALRHVIPLELIEQQRLKETSASRLPALWNKCGNPGVLFPHRPNFVPKSANTGRELSPDKCEASALTTELTAHFRAYFTPKNQLCKITPLASTNFDSDLGTLIGTYQLPPPLVAEMSYLRGIKEQGLNLL